jgi:hypothetical protein
MVPILLQLSTLVFGYIRRKNDTKHRLEVQKSKEYGLFRSEQESNQLETSFAGGLSDSSNNSFFDPPLFAQGMTSPSFKNSRV